MNPMEYMVRVSTTTRVRICPVDRERVHKDNITRESEGDKKYCLRVVGDKISAFGGFWKFKSGWETLRLDSQTGNSRGSN